MRLTWWAPEPTAGAGISESYLGSHGVVAEHVPARPATKARKRYSLLNQREVRGPVIKAAEKRYGYRTGQVELQLYVGKFATGAHRGAGPLDAQLGSVSVRVRSAFMGSPMRSVSSGRRPSRAGTDTRFW
jgi:hypothetical protein